MVPFRSKMVYKSVRVWAETLCISLYTPGAFLKKAYGNLSPEFGFSFVGMLLPDQPVPGIQIQIVERGRKIHEEKNTRGDQRGKGEGNLVPPPVLPVYNLTCSPLTTALYYLSTWNRLLPDSTSMKAFGQFYSHCVRFLVYEVKVLRILVSGVLPGSPNPDPISDQKLSFFTPAFRPGL